MLAQKMLLTLAALHAHVSHQRCLVLQMNSEVGRMIERSRQLQERKDFCNWHCMYSCCQGAMPLHQ